MSQSQIEVRVWSNPRLWSIALGEMLAWAGLFYLFPASLMRWKMHFNWSISDLSLALMISLIVSAITGIFVGKLIDKGFGRVLMSIGAAFGGVCLLLIPLVGTILEFYILWALVGIAMGTCLYDPCFAILTRHYSSKAKEAIVMVTLFAGFSITFSFILSGTISALLDWKTSFYVFGLLLCLLAAPLFWIGISSDTSGWPKFPMNCYSSKGSVELLRDLARNPFFWGLSVLFAVFALNHIMLLSQILPLFESRGISPDSAILLAAAMGFTQVGGRMALIAVEKLLKREFEIIGVVLFTASLLVCASILLYCSTASLFFLTLLVVFQGTSFGIINLAKPVITASLLGESGFGFISALVGVGYICGFAIAPGVSGIILDVWGVDTLIWIAFLFAVVGFVTFLVTTSKKFNQRGNSI